MSIIIISLINLLISVSVFLQNVCQLMSVCHLTLIFFCHLVLCVKFTMCVYQNIRKGEFCGQNIVNNFILKVIKPFVRNAGENFQSLNFKYYHFSIRPLPSAQNLGILVDKVDK